MTLRVCNANIWTRGRELHRHFCQLRRVSHPLSGSFFIISLKSVTVKTMSANFDRFTIIVTQNARTSLNPAKFLNGDGVGRGRNITVIRRGIVEIYRPSIVEGLGGAAARRG